MREASSIATWTNSQPAPAARVPALRAVAGDAVAEPLEAAELLDVDVDQLAGMLALVAADRLGRLEGLERLRPSRLRMRLTVAGETPASAAICLPVQRWRRRASTCATTAAGVGRRRRCGREERSFSPARPSASKRATHLRTVRGQTPAARAAAFGVCPLRTCAHNPLSTKRRQTGILVDVHPVLRESLKRRNSSFLAQDRMDNLLKERQLMEQIDYNLLFGGLSGCRSMMRSGTPPVFSKNRDRLLEAEVAREFLSTPLSLPKVKRLLSSDHFSVDGTLIDAWASMKSFRPKDGGGEPPTTEGRNGERNFRREKRSNETHASTTDPDAKLYRKGDGQESRLCYIGHVLMENRNGIAVAGEVTQATGTAEREAALDLIDAHRPGRGRITLGGDKAFDVEDFVQALRQRKVTPHITIDGHLTKTGKRRKTAIDKRTLRHVGYDISQRSANGSKRCSAGSRRREAWPRSRFAVSPRFSRVRIRDPGLQSHPDT